MMTALKKMDAYLESLNPLTWQVICLGCSALVLSLGLIPNLFRPLSLALRTGFGAIVPAVFIVLYLIFQIRGRIGDLLAMSAIVLLFGLALAGLWANGGTLSILINGLLPVSDAVAYYTDAQKIMHGIQISDFSGMRPIFPSFLSFLLWASRSNLMTALAIITGLAGLASYLAAREIQSTHGPIPSSFFVVLIFLYYRHHSGTTMSESLSLPVSLLGLALLWNGAHNKKLWNGLFGLTLISLALNIRPGAMFVLPAILLWGTYVYRIEGRYSKQFLILGFLLVAATFGVNKVMIRILAGPDAVAFGNFSWALYGLVSGGKSWTYIFEANPGFGSAGHPSVYRLILDQFLQNPMLAVYGAAKYYQAFFSNTWYNAYAFVAGENYWLNQAARVGMYLLGGLGVYKWLSKKDDPFSSLALIGALGVLASVPFVPPTDAYRVRLYAATIPFFILLPGIGLSFITEKIRSGWVVRILTIPSPPTSFTALIASGLIFLMLIPSTLLKFSGQPPLIGASICPPDSTRVVVRYKEGHYINLHRESAQFLDWMPNYHIGLFRDHTHDLADSNLTWRLEAIEPGTTLFYSLDFITNHEALVIIPTELLPQPGRLLSLCGQWDSTPQVLPYYLFYAETLTEMAETVK